MITDGGCLKRKMVSDNNDRTKSKTDRTREMSTKGRDSPRKLWLLENLNHGNELYKDADFHTYECVK